jgi:Protein of unknown function (DUF3108)
VRWHYCGVLAEQLFPFHWSRRKPQRALAGLGLAGVVLALHLGLLGGAGPPRQPGLNPPGEPTSRPLQVRQLAAEPAAPAAPAGTAADPPRPDARPQAGTQEPAPASEPSPPPGAIDANSPPAAATTRPIDGADPDDVEAAASGAPDPASAVVQTYATLAPPPLRLRYATLRGAQQGEAELTWQASADGWQLALQGSALGAAQVGWASRGGFDGAGLAPQRHAVLRRGREQRAVNFQRDAGRITFSGPGVTYPMLPGVQDRLSWWIQLPAVLQANPALTQVGAQVSLWVVGGRGDAEVWTFTVEDRGPLVLPAGLVADAVILLREPRRPYDQQVRVWLDPARHHLPVQAELRRRGGGDATRLQLLASEALPPEPTR